MGRDNHNAGMHFMRYPSKVSDVDAVAYLQKKELEKKQAEIREKYDSLSREFDRPCHFKLSDMKDRVRVNYYDEKYVTEWPMYHYEILNAKNKHNRRLTLWVGYDLGGTNYDTGEEEKRGYYLYFTNCFKRNISGRKILLLEVNKKTKASLEKAVEMACLYGKVIVSNYYYKLEINWDKPIYERYGFMSPWMNVPKVRCFRSIKNCILE
ncbi:MAG: hypothetical protein U0L85_05150 [Bacilli bacterium]|nr:hypothetical protein [Bacilli bacterium]